MDLLVEDTLTAIERVYDEQIRVHVHNRWCARESAPAGEGEDRL